MRIGITERGDAALSIQEWQSNIKTCDGAILITKNLTDEFINAVQDVNCIVHATVTGWGGSAIEPNVPTWQESLLQYNKLRKVIPHERIVLRIDPIIPTKEGIARALNIKDRFKHDRLRISFLDLYPHVKKRFTEASLKPPAYNFHAPLTQRKQIAILFPGAEICGEPEMNCTGCISKKDLKTLGLTAELKIGSQRNACRCLAVKQELLSNRGQCAHGCLYCYWH